VKNFLPSLVLAGGVLASLDGPEGFRTVMESLIDGLIVVQEGVAAFLRLSLFSVLVVGIILGRRQVWGDRWSRTA
jgi:hypothetical protein